MLTRDSISGRLRVGRKTLHLSPLRCSAHNTSQSEEVYILGVPAHSPNVKFSIQYTPQATDIGDRTAKQSRGFNFAGALSPTAYYSHCRKPSVEYLCHSSHIERGKRRWFEYGINAYFTDANPRFDLGTPAGWTEKLTPQYIYTFVKIGNKIFIMHVSLKNTVRY